MKNRLLSAWEAVRTSYWFVAAEHALGEIRDYGSGDPLVAARLLDTLRLLGEHVRDRENVRVLREQVERIWRSSQQRLQDEAEKQALEERYRAAVQVLGATAL